MATIIKRGSRTAPKFFIKFNAGVTADGKRVQRLKSLAGVRDMPVGAAAGRGGRARDRRRPRSVSRARDRPRFGRHSGRPLGRGPGNRNASNDRAMVKNHLRARFVKMSVDQITLPVLTGMDRRARSLGSVGADAAPRAEHSVAVLLLGDRARSRQHQPGEDGPVEQAPGARLEDRRHPVARGRDKVPELVKALGGDVGLMSTRPTDRACASARSAACGWATSILREGVIRVAHSYGGPLKEDKRGEGS